LLRIAKTRRGGADNAAHAIQRKAGGLRQCDGKPTNYFFEVTINPQTLTKRAQRIEEKEDRTNVQKKSNTEKKSNTYNEVKTCKKILTGLIVLIRGLE
jgi:hypothetical protein